MDKTLRSVFGIDLGTTFSAIAWVDPQGRTEIIPNQEGERLTPSVVLFESDASVVVGRVAAHEAIVQPARVIQSIKRFMGDPNWLRDFEGILYRPADVSALILRKLKRDAERYTGHPVEEVVITVPAYFGDAQRSATLEAAEIAGLRVLRLINEPTAAAMAFQEQRGEESGWLVVFDLGGGTCDVTVLEAREDGLHVRSSRGHAALGGQDWDESLVHQLAVHFVSLYGLDPLDEPSAYQGLLERVVQAKHSLSLRAQVNLSFSYAGFSLREEISRERFAAMCAPLLAQCEELCQLALEDAGISWEKVSALYLAGGATRMPMIQEMLQRLSGKSPQILLNPDEAVVRGAALQAARCLLDDASLSSVSHQQDYERMVRRVAGRVAAYDVSSHSLGVVLLDSAGRPRVERILSRHVPLPYQCQETYYTAYDHQVSIELRIVEGESERLDECVEVGTCELLGLPPRPAGQRVDVSFRYDLDGILVVEVFDVGTGRKQRVEMKRSLGRHPAEKERMRRWVHQQSL
ncbi:MAG: Hsp70 family protein [Myxococcales bacterium]|nr:Hsp70 family protein [Myxococcales bacterium]